MASKKKKTAKKTAKKAAKKTAKKAAKKTAKKAAKKTAKKAAKKTAKKAAKKTAKKAAKKTTKKAAKSNPTKPAAAMKMPAKKQAPERHALLTTSEAANLHIVPPAKKKTLDLSSLARAYKDDAVAHPVTTEQMEDVKVDGLRGDGEILQVDDDADVAPCRLVDHGEGRFSLCFDDFKMPDVKMFGERGLQGGGYTWEAIADSLVRLRRPDLADQFAWDSEAGMFVAVGNRPNLVLLARLLQEALANSELLKSAIDAADPDRLE
jgi:hypothetical protein